MARLLDLPLFVLFVGIAALAMAVPATHALATGAHGVAADFALAGALTLLAAALTGLATAGARPRSLARAHLAALAAAFTLLPAVMAVPFYMAVPATSFLNAWVEMVSSFTTTGATLFAPDRLEPSVHLWRAIVGWLGGYLMWVAAIAILAPMNLGGFEVTAAAGAGAGAGSRRDRTVGVIDSGDARLRLARVAARFLPIYGGLTGVLWLGLSILGETPFVAACHAMSVMATSGISPVGGLEAGGAGFGGELLILLFLGLAVTRLAFNPMRGPGWLAQIRADPEAQIAGIVLLVVPAILFLRHWLGAYEVDMVADLGSALRALWGAVFSVLSFLTTTGFLSADWETARAWSGLATPGIVLLALALVGGGVATTAGGVKLLRVYALYRHSARELERLIHPSSVGGAGREARRLRRQGA